MALLAGCMIIAAPAAAETRYGAFGEPQPVHIEGYAASAEEPFISPDGRYLLFNTSESEAEFTLQYATTVNAQTFDYTGPILGEGVNLAGSFSGTPSLDEEGDLYFVSPRSYFETLSTLYTGHFADGTVGDVHLVPGVAGAHLGLVDFDGAVSPDGRSLYVSVGQFGEGGAPSSASLALYERESGGGFAIAPDSSQLLAAVNDTAELVYAAAISADGLELFYTAASPAFGRAPSIYLARRSQTNEPFGAGEWIQAITGFAEAPSITSDGTTLYYHLKEGADVHVMVATRARYVISPRITSVRPSRGSAAGGTAVRILGSGLGGAEAVDFGGTPATDVHVDSAGEVSAVAPAGTSGSAAVSVTSAELTSEPSAKSHFTYSAPTVSEVGPDEGPLAGGTRVTISGSGFAVGEGRTSVRFGPVAASYVDCASTAGCTTVAPPARRAGSVAVSVIVGARRSSRRAGSDRYTYLAP